MDRRRFLNLAALSTGGALAGGLTVAPRAARADQVAWGDYPAAFANQQLAPNQRAKRVLELFVYGGLSPWETLYCITDPSYGKAKKWMIWTFIGAQDDLIAAQTKCAGKKVSLAVPWGVDSLGAQINLGPFAMPLWSRKDLTDRMRLHVVTHDIMPHQAAFPLAASGYRIGSPKLAGVGAHVQRYFQTRAKQTSPTPYAFVLRRDHRAELAAAAAAASGAHPGAARPLTLAIGDSAAFVHALKRTNKGKYITESDALLSMYAERYHTRLKRSNASAAARSMLTADYMHAMTALRDQSTALTSLLSADLFKPIEDTACGFKATGQTTRELKVAVRLLNNPKSDVRHVTVFDSALTSSPMDFGHDTHAQHVKVASVNYNYTFRALAEVINKPGEKNPAKLDLDDTLVVINTEFGRTPWAQGKDGRNHHPYAYVTAMLGGPVGNAQKGIVGAIDKSGNAVNPMTPAATRAATLVAMGIYPFADEAFAVSDVGAKNESEAIKMLRQKVLGV